MKNEITIITRNKEEFVRHLKSKFLLFHLSNIFFRDIHYGIISFAESKGKRISYGHAEELAYGIIRNLEESAILKPIKPGSWMLNYPQFRKPLAKPEPAAKAAPVSSLTKPSPATLTGVGSQPAPTSGNTGAEGVRASR